MAIAQRFPTISISPVTGTGVSSADETAKDLYRELVERDLLNGSEVTPHHHFVATGDTKAFATLARRFLGPEVVDVSRELR